MSAHLDDATLFYSDFAIVDQYEDGRSNRLLVPDLPRVLRVLRDHGEVASIPLHAIFDWLYWRRMTRMGVDLLSGSILDLGCGTSYVFRALMAAGWRGQVTGIDISRAMIEVGSRRIEHLLTAEYDQGWMAHQLYWYTDLLGRRIVDVAPPVAVVHEESARHLLTHRSVGDIRDLLDRRFDHVTAFSGPLCFFSVDEQEKILARICEIAGSSINVQFKNAAFARFGSSRSDLDLAGEAIEHVFRNQIIDSMAFMNSIALKFESVDQECEPVVQHEVGGFSYHTISVDRIRGAADRVNYAISRLTTLGFISEYFFDLATEFYREYRDSPDRLLRLFQALSGVDDYFCERLMVGDNLHISATPHATTRLFSTPTVRRSGGNFRFRYRPRD